MKKEFLVLMSVSFSLCAQEEPTAPPVYQDSSYVAAWKAQSLKDREERGMVVSEWQQKRFKAERDFYDKQPAASPRLCGEPHQVTNVNIVTFNCNGDDTTTCCNGDGCCAIGLKLFSSEGFLGTYVPVIFERVSHLVGLGSEDDDTPKEE